MLKRIWVLVLLLGCKQQNVAPDLSIANGTVPCNQSADCPTILPMCHPDSHICVGCLSNFQTCGEGLTCDDATHTCVTASPNMACRRNADCPRPGFDDPKNVTCERDAGICFQCVGDVDCVDPDVCVQRLHVCGDACLECLPGQICDRGKRQCLDPDGGV